LSDTLFPWEICGVYEKIDLEKINMPKKVFVSGCFDLLHSGHVAFFQEAARYGDLFVAIGSVRTFF